MLSLFLSHRNKLLNKTVWEVVGCNPRQHIWKCQMNTSVFHSNLLLWRFPHVSFKQTVLLPYKTLGMLRAWILLWTKSLSKKWGRILIRASQSSTQNMYTYYIYIYKILYIFIHNSIIILNLISYSF